MRNAIRVLTVACIGWVAVAAAGNTIRLSFTVVPEETLPFIPVHFQLRAVNTGSAAATLPVVIRLEARTGAADWAGVCLGISEHSDCTQPLPVQLPEDSNLSDLPPSIELAPGEERVLDFLAGPDSPPWFAHADLWKPGTYRLRLVTVGHPTGTGPITSNEAVLTIATPTGEDAGAWKLIGGDPFSRGGFADQLWSLYPNSVYTAITPRGIVAYNQPKNYLAAFTEVLGKNPPQGFVDAFKREMATAHTRLMEDAAHEFDVQKAFQHADAARRLYQELAGKETEAKLKAEAASAIENDSLTLARVEEYVDNLRFLKPASACERADVKRSRSALIELMRRAEDKQAEKTLGDAIANLDKYEADAAKTPPEMHAALASLEQAANRIETAVKGEWIPTTDGMDALKALARAAELSATKAIDASSKEPKVKQSDLDLAKRKLEEARAMIEAGDFKQAISRFREALHKAESASPARGSFC